MKEVEVILPEAPAARQIQWQVLYGKPFTRVTATQGAYGNVWRRSDLLTGESCD